MSKRELEKFSLKHLYSPYLTSLDCWHFLVHCSSLGSCHSGCNRQSHTHLETAQVWYFWPLFKYFILKLPLYLPESSLVGFQTWWLMVNKWPVWGMPHPLDLFLFLNAIHCFPNVLIIHPGLNRGVRFSRPAGCHGTARVQRSQGESHLTQITYMNTTNEKTSVVLFGLNKA